MTVPHYCTVVGCGLAATYETVTGDAYLCNDHAADLCPYVPLRPTTPHAQQKPPPERVTTCWYGGHDLTDPANVYERPDGSRYCRLCRRRTRTRRHTRSAA